MGQWMGTQKAVTCSSESDILDDLLSLAARKEAEGTQIIQNDVGVEPRVAQNSTFFDTVSTTEIDKKALFTNNQERHDLPGRTEEGTDEWLTTIERLILDGKIDEVKGMVKEKERLSADHDDIWKQFIVAGLEFQACVNSHDDEGAWDIFWQSMRLMLKIVEVDGVKVKAPFIHRLVTGSVDEFYELLVRYKRLWKCTLCLQAGVALNAIFSSIEGCSICFQNLEVADGASRDEARPDEESDAEADVLYHGDALESLYRLFEFAQHGYELTRIGTLLADQSFQLLLLHDNILFTETETFKSAASCLAEEWEKFGAGDYVTAIEKLRKWTGEINKIGAGKKMECHGSNVNEGRFAAWQRELEMKSLGFLGLHHYEKKDYTAAKTNLIKSISLTLEQHTELDSVLQEDVYYLFGKALFNTLRKLGKSDPCFQRTFDHQLSVAEASPFKYRLEYKFGKWLFKAGHKILDKTAMNRSVELLWESSTGLVQLGDIDYAIAAYANSIAVAMIMNEDNFDKPWEIVLEALRHSEIRDDHENWQRLWRILWDVARASSKPIQKGGSVYTLLQRAIKGLEEAESLAMQEDVEEHRIFYYSRVLFSKAELLILYSKSLGISNAREQLDDAIKLLDKVCKQLEERQKLDGEAFLTDASELLEDARNALKDAYGLASEHWKAAETSLHSIPALSVETDQRIVLLKSKEAISMSSWGSHNRAMDAINEAILEVESNPELRGDWKLQVSLLFDRSSILRKAGQMEASLEDMVNAQESCKAHDFAFGGNMGIFEGFLSLLEHYIDSKDYNLAWELVKGIDATARNDFAKGPNVQFVDKYAHWNHLLSKLLMLRTQHEGRETSGFWNRTASSEITAESGLVFTSLLTDAMCNTGMPLAERHAIIDHAELVITRDGRSSKDVQTPPSDVMLKNVFQCYLDLVDGDGEGALRKLQMAITNLESFPSRSRQNHTSLDIVHLYALQAFVYVALGLSLDAYTTIERAGVLMKRTQKEIDPLYLHAKRFVEFYVNASPEIAADAGRKLISQFKDGQSQIPSAMVFGWVQTLDEKASLYRRMELIAFEQDNPLEALVWAERGQMRLFMHIVENDNNPLGATDHVQESTSIPTETKAEGRFDRDDGYAAEILLKALKSCPPNVTIVKYSYFDQNESLLVYLLTEEKWTMRLIPDMGKEFGRLLDNPKLLNQTFAQHVKKLLLMIKKKDDLTAKQYLSNLFKLMIEPALLHLPKTCDTLVFAHHGLLSRLPLHALYDDSKLKFLIQQKRVCYIPSMRVLRYCYQRQDEFVRNFERGALKPPFIAGDPKPMGRRMRQLSGAREEAQAVAKILLGKESDAFVGEMVTKEAVKEALCDSSLTLLSTHCDGKALILQARGQQQQGRAQSAKSTQQTDVDRSLDPEATRSNAGAYDNTGIMVDYEPVPDVSSDGDEDLIRGATMLVDGELDEEMLTVAEIGLLRVRSGLVVLDGCGTNEGQVSQEGLLGLGRALLQAGTPMAILTLWSVNDAATRTLVTSLFENAHVKQMDVLGSLQKAMDDMIKEGGKNIYHWAPLVALGSPTMQLPFAKAGE